MEGTQPKEDIINNTYSRRDFLRLSGVSALGVFVMATLAACGNPGAGSGESVYDELPERLARQLPEDLPEANFEGGSTEVINSWGNVRIINPTNLLVDTALLGEIINTYKPSVASAQRQSIVIIVSDKMAVVPYDNDYGWTVVDFIQSPAAFGLTVSGFVPYVEIALPTGWAHGQARVIPHYKDLEPIYGTPEQLLTVNLIHELAAHALLRASGIDENGESQDEERVGQIFDQRINGTLNGRSLFATAE